MTISKRTREQAAMLCALMASSNRQTEGEFLVDFEQPFCTAVHQQNFGEACAVCRVDCHANGAAADLARLAYWNVSLPLECSDDMCRKEWAEAESLLRTGWSP